MSKQGFLVTLPSSGKKVKLRKLTIGLRRQAVQAASSSAGDNNALLSLDTQDEMLKILIVEIDGKKPPREELEVLDNFFDMEEYNELMLIVQEVAGLSPKKPKLEMITL